MIFLSSFLDITRINNFFSRKARFWNSLPIEWLSLTYDLHGFKSRISRNLLTIGFLKLISWSSGSCNSMLRSGCLALHGVNSNFKKMRFTTLLIDDAMFVSICLFDDLILGFCYSNLTRETGGFELASTITIILQVNQLTECASHPK